MRRSTGLYFVLIICTGLLIGGCGKTPENAHPGRKVRVHTAVVELKELSIPILTSGKLRFSKESKLSFKTPGILSRIYSKEGVAVNKNARMAALDLAEINARVDQARSANEKANRDLERAKKLYIDKVVTLEQLQNAETARDVARSELEIAEFNLRHAVIYAPEDGFILKKFSEEGELLAAGQPVLLFGSGESGWVIQAGITDRQIVRINAGDTAQVVFDAYPKRVFKARLSEIEAVANPYTGTFEVEIRVLPEGETLYSGFIGRVTLFPKEKQRVHIIPIEALTEGNQKKAHIFTPNADRKSVSRHTIVIDRIWENQVLVLSGLENIREVITNGVQYLDEKSEIEIVSTIK